jgi:two-component system chemotaxis response regulator CheB
LKAIQRFNEGRPDAEPVRAIMLSAHTKEGSDATVEALSAGAFDFIEKPESPSPEDSIAKLRESLRGKLNAIPCKNGRPQIKPRHATVLSRPARSKGGVEAVAIGVSTGGPKALTEMLPELCRLVKLPILIVQHMPPGFTKSLAQQLNAKCEALVAEAQDGDFIEEGRVYIAPGGKHMTVKRMSSHTRIVLTDAPPENGCRPSVDVLFRTVAATYGQAAVAAILTGMGSDGAKACKDLKASGARIIVQDEATSVVWGMPGSALATGLVERVEPLQEIPNAIKAMCGL